ncbi:MAG TPA: benzoyl-CoA reductase subunit D [Vicinamibacterales bacterium]|nr:benzoyl-CoA reductase subunit D [Vicinamibacterales bacterium]
MYVTAGVDVGSGAVKVTIMETGAGDDAVLANASARISRREVSKVVDEVFRDAVNAAGVDAIHYVATTGEGSDVPFATGHFYGMTTHARGALYLAPEARAVLDVGALHTRALAMDPNGRVLDYKMTSQCASGSGQFLENIARYLGVSHDEIGPLSLQATSPEKVSSICAVLAETDVINMVSRGIATADILRGVHDSMAERFARLLRSLAFDGPVFVTGGLASDIGMIGALRDALARKAERDGMSREVITHADAIFAGAIGAAIWGGFRFRKLGRTAPSWRAAAAAASA